MKTVILDLDKYLSWRSSEEELCLCLTNGDTAVLTLSENGHDAQAIHLEIGKVVKISAGHWFTIETVETEFDRELAFSICLAHVAKPCIERNHRRIGC